MAEELRLYLESKLKEHQEKNPEDNANLQGALLEWGAAVLYGGTKLYDAIRTQVESQARKYNTTPREFIDHLFGQDNYDGWMREFQT